MISIIAYVIHFYILPRKVYSGINAIEEWLEGVRAWDATFNAANWIDIILCVIGISIVLWKLFKTKDTSSKTEG